MSNILRNVNNLEEFGKCRKLEKIGEMSKIWGNLEKCQNYILSFIFELKKLHPWKVIKITKQ